MSSSVPVSKIGHHYSPSAAPAVHVQHYNDGSHQKPMNFSSPSDIKYEDQNTKDSTSFGTQTDAVTELDTLTQKTEPLSVTESITNGDKTLPSRDLNSRREDYLQWPDYFMALAFLAAKRSKDPCSQVGACIVDPGHKIVGLGYNGFPIGCSDDEFPWRKGDRTDLNSKYMYVCHAEMNAILNKISADVRGCTMYVGLFPCAECAKLIIQAGLKKVYYMSDKHAHKPETIASKRMFDATGVEYEQYIPKSEQIVIDFTEINWNSMTQMPPTPKKS